MPEGKGRKEGMPGRRKAHKVASRSLGSFLQFAVRSGSEDPVPGFHGVCTHSVVPGSDVKFRVLVAGEHEDGRRNAGGVR